MNRGDPTMRGHLGMLLSSEGDKKDRGILYDPPERLIQDRRGEPEIDGGYRPPAAIIGRKPPIKPLPDQGGYIHDFYREGIVPEA